MNFSLIDNPNLQPHLPSVVFNLEQSYGSKAQRQDHSSWSQTDMHSLLSPVSWTQILSRFLEVSFLTHLWRVEDELNDAIEPYICIKLPRNLYTSEGSLRQRSQRDAFIFSQGRGWWTRNSFQAEGTDSVTQGQMKSTRAGLPMNYAEGVEGSHSRLKIQVVQSHVKT